jgi:4'-phosphopantetheinyl transferase
MYALIGLSYIPRTAGQEKRHSEGRRMLRLIDQNRFPNRIESRIETEPGGRPFFEDRRADFNISHSKNLVALSYYTAPFDHSASLLRTGCDAQYIDARKNTDGIARRAFLPAEREYIAASADDAEKTRRFYRLWTFKESYIKLYGWSVFDMRKVPLFLPNAEDAPLLEIAAFRQYLIGDVAERYVLSVIWEGGAGDKRFSAMRPEFRWFSEPLPVSPL